MVFLWHDPNTMNKTFIRFTLMISLLDKHTIHHVYYVDVPLRNLRTQTVYRQGRSRDEIRISEYKKKP